MFNKHYNKLKIKFTTRKLMYLKIKFDKNKIKR